MRTPAGVECPHYYEDFNRGAEIERCRVPRAPGSQTWRPSQCARCPVPGILRSNGSPDLLLSLRAARGVLGFGERLTVEARCRRHGVVPDPHVGCPDCLPEMPDE